MKKEDRIIPAKRSIIVAADVGQRGVQDGSAILGIADGEALAAAGLRHSRDQTRAGRGFQHPVAGAHQGQDNILEGLPHGGAGSARRCGDF